MAHPLLVWMPAKMRGSSSRAYKSLKISPELFLPGFSQWTLAPLPGTKAALMLSLCAPSRADPHTLILLRSFLKIGTFILLNINSALIPNPFPL
eukprot:188375-Pelagomonas_calceolata.AAC.1